MLKQSRQVWHGSTVFTRLEIERIWFSTPATVRTLRWASAGS